MTVVVVFVAIVLVCLLVIAVLCRRRQRGPLVQAVCTATNPTFVDHNLSIKRGRPRGAEIAGSAARESVYEVPVPDYMPGFGDECSAYEEPTRHNPNYAELHSTDFPVANNYESES